MSYNLSSTETRTYTTYTPARPGDYLGGDGGMDSDYDDVLAPSEFYGTDEKGDAAFGEHGFGAEERNPIYQVTLPPSLSLSLSLRLYTRTHDSHPSPAV
jgi:hypothetical protein